MRRLFALVVSLLFALCPVARAETALFHAGIARFPVAAAAPFDVLVWYPTTVEEVPWRAGPFMVPASRDAAVASGRFPIVLLSHGGGPGGGSPLVLLELSASLARQGFIVVAPFHGKTGLQARPLQVRLALDAVLADARFASHADLARLGMLGFSLGTAVTLEVAGAIPNPAHLISYCSAHPDDVMSCDHSPDGKTVPQPDESHRPPAPTPPSPLPVKAIVLLDPFAVLFRPDGMAAVTMPVLVFRPDRSEMRGEAGMIPLAAALPHPPEVQIVPGRHFIFVDVCSAEVQSAAPEICRDPPGVDRAAVHAGIEAQIARFFHANL